MKILFTICARKGSKGVESKNIKLLLGKPLIYYTLKFVDIFKEKHIEFDVDYVVSSDSNEILDYSKNHFNAIIRNREPALATDTAAKVPVIIDACLFSEKIKSKSYDYVIDLDVTSPLRKCDNIIEGLDKIINNDFDVVFSVVESRRNPYFNMVKVEDDFVTRVISSNYVARQQAPEVFDMNASIYIFRRTSLGSKIKFSSFEGKASLIKMEDTYVIDIDKNMDFIILEILIKNYYANKFAELFNNVKDN
jgi:CMP-N,N'-diacetyllegionaminic acid synthase